ncbi:MAG: 2-hydroxyglutaryl-CoA dehydratase [Deltaproteobacteria bacterium]|nr:MAG: 2-hydroxyglutaryl-CoA dehydratase [Deltaproteobacteria bacterium]
MSQSLAALGLDVGSTTTKIVGVDGDGVLAWHQLEPMDPRMEEQAERLVAAARQAAGAAGELPLVATGYGRDLVRGADRKVTEITCHGRGIFAAVGHGGTLVDIGGQDSKVITVDDRGRVLNFAMNDKCAAGTGRFLEVVAQRLKLSLTELSDIALSCPEEVAISNTCTVFAESEIVSLLARGRPIDQIVRGLHRSLVKRVGALAKSAGIVPPVMLSGGVARSAAVAIMVGEQLGHPVELPTQPQLMGAFGAALIALEG